jgi:hypothetical protein
MAFLSCWWEISVLLCKPLGSVVVIAVLAGWFGLFMVGGGFVRKVGGRVRREY